MASRTQHRGTRRFHEARSDLQKGGRDAQRFLADSAHLGLPMRRIAQGAYEIAIDARCDTLKMSMFRDG